MIRWIYSLVMTALTPFLLLRLWWKGRALSSYREGILDRFSLNQGPSSKVDLWIHAVSLGEVVAVTPLIEMLLKQDLSILVTTMTPTGANQVRKHFGTRVTHQYVPYDIPWVVKRFYQKVKPRAAVLVEKELWPNLVFYAHKTGIPLFLINGRLSERAYQRYAKLKYFFKPILNQFDYILAQYEEDAKRYKLLGAAANRVAVLGNMKFDVQLKAVDCVLASRLKQRWGEKRPVIMLASTHDHEEQLVLARFNQMQKRLHKPLLLIAPRHPERFQAVYQMSKQMGFHVGLRSQNETITAENDVVILDSIGELLAFYSISDCAFVGGSLVPLGGHNVLEPIAMQTPVLCGPHRFNFKNICDELEDAQAIELVNNADELIEKVICLLKDQNRKNNLIDKASLILQTNRGVVAQYLERINAALSHS